MFCELLQLLLLRSWRQAQRLRRMWCQLHAVLARKHPKVLAQEGISHRHLLLGTQSKRLPLFRLRCWTCTASNTVLSVSTSAETVAELVPSLTMTRASVLSLITLSHKELVVADGVGTVPSTTRSVPKSNCQPC